MAPYATNNYQILMNVASPSSFISENNKMCLSGLFKISYLDLLENPKIQNNEYFP